MAVVIVKHRFIVREKMRITTNNMTIIIVKHPIFYRKFEAKYLAK